jgi:hypothetical protein
MSEEREIVMPHEHQVPTVESPEKVSSLDDVPRLARLSLWQKRISQNYQLIALAPFTVLIFVTLTFFAQSTSRIWDFLIGLTLIWAIIVAGYAFYSLFWGVGCPVCANGFGVREACRSCGLPRHRSAPSMFDFHSKVRLFEEE